MTQHSATRCGRAHFLSTKKFVTHLCLGLVLLTSLGCAQIVKDTDSVENGHTDLAEPKFKGPILAQSQRPTIHRDIAALKTIGLKRGDTTLPDILARLSKQKNTQLNDSNFKKTRHHKDKTGRQYYRYIQQHNGLDIYNSYLKYVVDQDGNVVNLIERIADSSKPVKRMNLPAKAAIIIAAKHNYGSDSVKALTLNQEDYFEEPPTSKRIFVEQNNYILEAFEITLWNDKNGLDYSTIIGPNGKVISNELNTYYDQYNAVLDNPVTTPQTMLPGVGNGTPLTPSPIGWLLGPQYARNIQGNNVHAYRDSDLNEIPDVPYGPQNTSGDFDYAYDLSIQPYHGANPTVGVQNLFYLTNMMHDRTYAAGFTEGAGNFQLTHINDPSAPGDGDRLLVELKGFWTNNGAFRDRPDGISPRLEAYLWKYNPYTVTRRDSALDSDVIWHEYGHGVPLRMVGPFNGDVAGAIGEGLADTMAIIHNDDDALGEWLEKNNTGIRSARYGQHTDTISDFDASRGRHRNGEILGATMWTAWESYKSMGLSVEEYLEDLVSAYGFMAPYPDYFEVRDALIAAVTPKNRQCIFWQAFSSKGMGSGGSMNASGSTIVESFANPCAIDPPLNGFITYVGEAPSGTHLYVQPMIGMTPTGSPTQLYSDTNAALINMDARYPQVTEDGRFIVFITRKSTSVASNPEVDEVVIMDHTGFIWKKFAGNNYLNNGGDTCATINYPEIINYEYGGSYLLSKFVIAATCVENWSVHETMIMASGPDASNYYSASSANGWSQSGINFVDGLEHLPPTEFAAHSYDGSSGYIISSHNKELIFSQFEHGTPGDDHKVTGNIYIDPLYYRDGGHCKNVPPCSLSSPLGLTDAFAPSVSPNGKLVMFNSEAYNYDNSIGEELFVVALPPGDLATEYLGLVPYQSKILDMSHANTKGDDYGTFTANALYQYIIHNKAGDSLRIAPDLNALPVTLSVPVNVSPREPAWFYK